MRRQVNFRGQVLGEEYNDGTSYQLLSIAGDGQVLIWDTRWVRVEKTFSMDHSWTKPDLTFGVFGGYSTP